MLSLIGIIVAVALFVFMAIKGHNLVVAAVIAAAIMAITGGLPIYQAMAGTYVAKEGAAPTGFMTSFAGFVKSYGLLFIFSSLLGRMMSDGGAARRIALTAAKLVENASETNKKFMCCLLVPLLYIILSYVGISGFVIVFTIMPIAKELFMNTDTPWKMYCFGGPQAVGVTMLVGSLQAGNIYASNVCGTSTTAGAALSIVAYIVWLVATVLVIKVMLNKAIANGETFLTDGAAVKAAGAGAPVLPEDKLPNFIVSIIPLVVAVVLSAGFKMEVVPALFISCVLCLILFWKNITKDIKGTLTNGVTSCFGSIFTVAATFAMGSMIRVVPGFSVIMGAFNALPALLSGIGLTFVSAFVMASASSNILAFGETILGKMTEAGLTNGAAHRLMTISGFSCMGPHNAGIANACAVTKIQYNRCLKVYMFATWIPGACAAIAAILMAVIMY